MTWALHTRRQAELQKLAVRIEGPFKIFASTRRPSAVSWRRHRGRERSRYDPAVEQRLGDADNTVVMEAA